MKNIKLLLTAALSTAFMFVLTSCNTQIASKSDAINNKAVFIGVYEPASGDNGAGGKQETLGIQYAHDKINTVNINGENYDVNLIVLDNESSVDKAPSVAQELVSKGSSVILGSYGSSVSLAASDIFKKGGVPAIGITCTNPQVTTGNNHYFRICYLDSLQGSVLANYAKSLGATKAYCLSKLGDDYSCGLVHYFEESFKSFGGEVFSEIFEENETDFVSHIMNSENLGAQVFFAPVSTEAATLIIEQSAAQNMKIPILSGDTWDSNVILNAAKGKDLNIFITTFYQEGGNPKFDSAIKKWVTADSSRLENNGGDDKISAATAMGYDAYFVALQAIEKAGSTDPVKVNAALWDVCYDGVCGNIIFDETGNSKRETAYIKIVNTKTGNWNYVLQQGIH